MSTAARPQEVFHSQFVVEPQRVQDVVKAVLGAILFYRSLGNAEPAQTDCLGIAMPSLVDTEGTRLINERAQAVAHALQAAGTQPGRADYTGGGKEIRAAGRVVVALYPTPLSITSASSTASGVALPLASAARASTTQGTSHRGSSSRSRIPSATSAASAAATATGAVSSALGWFSASAKALTGAEERDRRTSSAPTGGAGTSDSESSAAQLEAVWGLERVWEAWVLDFELVEPESESRRRSGSGGGGRSADERLRHQLNDFSLRAIDFVVRKTAHVPPITTAELRPFGVRILIDPPVLPVAAAESISADASTPVDSFPRLHTALAGPLTDEVGATPGVRQVYAQYGWSGKP